MSKQKFPIGSRVYVTKNMPTCMQHFECGFEGIVEYTYAEEYGGNDYKSYSILELEDEKPVGTIAWYEEDQLTLVSSDIVTGKALLKLNDKLEEDEDL